MNNISPKQFFKNFGVLIFLIILTMLVLIPLTYASNKSWKNGLKVSVDNVLNEEEKNWQIGENIEINNPMTNSCAAYNIKNLQTQEEAIAIILRNTSFFGPLPAVFIYHNEDDIEFIKYSTLHGRVAKQIYDKPQNKRVEYWLKKIPLILNN